MSGYFSTLYRCLCSGLMVFSCYCAEECRNLNFRPRVENQALKGHVIDVVMATSEGHCQILCYKEARCVSYNLGPLTNCSRTCELSDSDDILHPNDLQERGGFSFSAAENPCANRTCPGVNSTCLVGFTERGSKCQCAKGLTGNLCDIDIDECAEDIDECVPNALCSNTYASYECVCKPHFTGDGSNCSAENKNCLELYQRNNIEKGVFTIDPDGRGQFPVRCTGNILWGFGLVDILRRFDGQEDFYRGWNDYKNGFGDLEGDFWLGLDKIHRLTNQADCKLRVALKDWGDNWFHAEYEIFKVDGEENNYRLTVGHFLGGSAGDSLSYHNNQPFATKDRFDLTNSRCARAYKGAWWYGSCHQSNLNGLYKQGGNHASYADGINWITWRGHYYSAKAVAMAIRPV